MLAVVEDEKDLPVADVVGERIVNGPVRSLSNVEDRCHLLSHEARVGQGRQVDDPDAVRKAIEHLRAKVERQARLAAPAGARQRQQASGCHEFQELRDFPIAPDEVRELDGKVVTGDVATLRRRHLAEGVPKAVHRPNETGMHRIVAERLPDFAHQIREVLLHHEGAGPEAILQLGLRERLVVALDQEPEQLKRLRRQRDRRA